MNDIESYDDPKLAASVRAWMQREAPAAAPERLVYSVMDDVGRSPRRRWLGFGGRPLLRAAARYAALTLVIAIGVAAGIALSGRFPSVGGPTPSPTPMPSLRFVGVVADNGRLLASDAERAWLVSSSRELVPIDADGASGASIAIPFMPSDVVTATGRAIPLGEMTVWLAAPDADLLGVDPSSGELVSTNGARGTRVAVGAGAAWLGAPGQLIKVVLGDDAHRTFQVPGHRAEDPILVVGNAVWAATSSGIARLDASAGAEEARIPIDASSMVFARGSVWVAQGSHLIALNPTSGTTSRSVALSSGAGDIVAIATHGGTVWVATAAGLGPPSLIGVDPTTGGVISITTVAAPAESLAVVGSQVWTLDASGQVGRYEPG